MSNIVDLSAFKSARPPKDSEDGELMEPRAGASRRYRRSGRNMHNLVFRSYSLIVEAASADLIRDVRVDTHKAKVKLRKIREQIVIDRDKAAARAELMSKAEARLSAAIDEAAGEEMPEEPPAQGGPLLQRREFNEAMRRRINIVALLRDLSLEQIKPVLTLKHYQIAKFIERHGVNLEWLLEGNGRVFNNQAIASSSAMSGAEFETLVRSLPEEQQRKVEAVMDLFLEDRGR